MEIRELYRFTMGSSIWTYSKGSGIYTYNAETYNPTPLKRGRIVADKNLNKASVEITLDIDNNFSQSALTLSAVNTIYLSAFGWNGSAYVLFFKGRATSKKPIKKDLKINFESFITYGRAHGLRPKYGKGCKAILYGRGCWLNQEDFVENLTATSYTGNVYTVTGADGFADGYFRGGMLKDPDDNIWYITNHVGTSITLHRNAVQLKEDIDSSSTAVDLYPGCDHSRVVCRNTFNNELNYMGQPHLYKNPMDGRNIYGG